MNEDQVQFFLSTIPYVHTSALSCPSLQDSLQDQSINEHLPAIGGSSAQLFFDTELAVDRATREEQTTAGAPPAKWMSSKMRLMRKMMGEDRIVAAGKQGGQGGLIQDQAQPNHPDCSSSNGSTGIIRVCSNCNTTKTPLWRSGPQGPKSLCNACGIRQMKARRALRAAAAAAAAVNGGSVLVPAATALPPKKAPKEERSEVDRTVPFKKRFKIAAAAAAASSAQKKLPFDDITISLTKKLAFHQAAFPQEEKDAAILLMALSCGLIHG